MSALLTREIIDAAHKAVIAAVARGELVRPSTCSRCGRSARRINAHHDDYAKPLDVMWLCTGCHFARHAELKTGTDGRSRCPKCGLLIFRHIEYGGHVEEIDGRLAHKECERISVQMARRGSAA